jgi:hypothetical protein
MGVCRVLSARQVRILQFDTNLINTLRKSIRRPPMDFGFTNLAPYTFEFDFLRIYYRQFVTNITPITDASVIRLAVDHLRIQTTEILLREDLRYAQAYAINTGNHNWNCVPQLFQLEYWSRFWIAQEICLARRVTLLCGNSGVSLGAVLWCLTRGGSPRDPTDRHLCMTDYRTPC